MMMGRSFDPRPNNGLAGKAQSRADFGLSVILLVCRGNGDKHGDFVYDAPAAVCRRIQA